jgi:hypothetical protein
MDHSLATNPPAEDCKTCLRQRIEKLEALIDRAIADYNKHEWGHLTDSFDKIIEDMRKAREDRE